MFDLAIYYRMVGGFVGLPSTTLARLRWAITIACYMAFASMVHNEGLAQYAVVFVGVFIGGFLGRLIPHSMFQTGASIKNSMGMTLVQGARLALILAPYFLSPLVIDGGVEWLRLVAMVAAVGSGIGYYVGWKYLQGIDSGIYYRNKPTQWIISDLPAGVSIPVPAGAQLDQAAVAEAEWGELLTGFLCYQLFYVMLLVIP